MYLLLLLVGSLANLVYFFLSVCSVWAKICRTSVYQGGFLYSCIKGEVYCLLLLGCWIRGVFVPVIDLLGQVARCATLVTPFLAWKKSVLAEVCVLSPITIAIQAEVCVLSPISTCLRTCNTSVRGKLLSHKCSRERSRVPRCRQFVRATLTLNPHSN